MHAIKSSPDNGESGVYFSRSSGGFRTKRKRLQNRIGLICDLGIPDDTNTRIEKRLHHHIQQRAFAF